MSASADQLRDVRDQVARLVAAVGEVHTLLERMLAVHDSATVEQQLRAVERLVVAEWGVPLERLRSAERPEEVVIPRHVAMHLAFVMFAVPQRKISAWLHRKNHCTVLHGLRSLQARLEQEPRLRARVDRLEALLRQEVFAC